jgi:pyrroline-5-carboxylate reductase
MSAAVVLVGCGNMGGALLSGWLERGLSVGEITVVEPDERQSRLAAQRGVTVLTEPREALRAKAPELVVLAVKPQIVVTVLPAYAPFAAAGSAFLSIVAGKPVAVLSAGLGARAAVVRAMPNTPAAIGRGISVAFANAETNEHQKALSDELLSAVGSVLWVEDETLLDPVTAVSGSGPAYVFLLAECLARAGEEAGLPADIARRLARETVAGAGELLARSNVALETLRRNVTSPGGTTDAALSVLMDADSGLQPLFSRAVAVATRRSRELAG